MSDSDTVRINFQAPAPVFTLVFWGCFLWTDMGLFKSIVLATGSAWVVNDIIMPMIPEKVHTCVMDLVFL